MSKKTAVDLINAAAANANLTPREAVLNLARLALHTGVNDPDKLRAIGPALGHIAQGIGKVAAAEASKAGGRSGLEELQGFMGQDDEG